VTGAGKRKARDATITPILTAWLRAQNLGNGEGEPPYSARLAALRAALATERARLALADRLVQLVANPLDLGARRKALALLPRITDGLPSGVPLLLALDEVGFVLQALDGLEARKAG